MSGPDFFLAFYNNPWAFYTVLVLVLIVLPALLFSRFTKQKVYLVFTMLRTRFLLGVLDWLAGLWARFWLFFADIGIVLGFGALGLDYIWGRKQNKPVRVTVFVLFTVVSSLAMGFAFSRIMSLYPTFSVLQYFIYILSGLFGSAGFIISVMAVQGIDIIVKLLVGREPCPGVAPVIPGVKVPKVDIEIPLSGWIAFAIILIVHEFSHGILSRALKVKVRSMGLILVGLFPVGAFAEPDQKQTEKLPKRGQLQIYSAGSMANYATGIVFLIGFLVLSASFLPFAQYTQDTYAASVQGVRIVGVMEEFDLCGDVYPSYAHGVVDPDSRVKAINGIPVTSGKQMALIQSSLGPGQEVLFEWVHGGQEKHALIKLNELNKIGITVQDIPVQGFEFPFAYLFLKFLVTVFFYTFLLNILVGAFNFIPTEPFDGGKMNKIILLDYLKFWKGSKKRKTRILSSLFGLLVIILLLINALPYFF